MINTCVWNGRKYIFLFFNVGLHGRPNPPTIPISLEIPYPHVGVVHLLPRQRHPCNGGERLLLRVEERVGRVVWVVRRDLADGFLGSADVVRGGEGEATVRTCIPGLEVQIQGLFAPRTPLAQV